LYGNRADAKVTGYNDTTAVNYTVSFFKGVELASVNLDTTVSTVVIGYFSSFNTTENLFSLLNGDKCSTELHITSTVTLLCLNESFMDLSPPHIFSDVADQPCMYHLSLGGQEYCAPSPTTLPTSLSTTARPAHIGTNSFVLDIVLISVVLLFFGTWYLAYCRNRQGCYRNVGTNMDTAIYEAVAVAPENAAAAVRMDTRPLELEVPVYRLDGTSLKTFSGTSSGGAANDGEGPATTVDVISVSAVDVELTLRLPDDN
jgi:hypothetical protein